MNNNEKKIHKAILRKTCISNLPEELKNSGESYVLIPSAKDEAEIITHSEFQRLADQLEKESDDPVVARHARIFFRSCTDLYFKGGTTAYISPAWVSCIGESGDRLDVFFDEEKNRWIIRNPKKHPEHLE